MAGKTRWDGESGQDLRNTHDASWQMRHETACPKLTRVGTAPGSTLSGRYRYSPWKRTSSIPTMTDLKPLDPEYVAEQLSRPPFVSISGVVNARDLGGCPTDTPGFITKPNLVYRSGEVSYITEGGK